MIPEHIQQIFSELPKQIGFEEYVITVWRVEPFDGNDNSFLYYASATISGNPIPLKDSEFISINTPEQDTLECIAREVVRSFI